MANRTKTILKIIATALVVAFIVLLVRFIIVARYTNPYNKGNRYYKKQHYSAAIGKYEEALKHNPPKKKICDIRTNLALAMVKTFDENAIDEDNVQDVLNTLYAARDVLLADGCAADAPDVGHDEDAQTLKEEIDELIKKLEQMQNEQNDPNDDPNGGGGGGGNGGGEGEEPQDPMEQDFLDMLEQGQNSRNDEMGEYEMFHNEFNFEGDCW